jgi:hypothetical protein
MSDAAARGWVTPAETIITEDSIPAYRAVREPTKFAGCTQVSSLFLKADGKISCSCMRYRHVLADAREVDVGEFFNGVTQRYIRESFLAGAEPFDFCQGCVSRMTSFGEYTEQLNFFAIHVEPSSQCNLFCEECTCTFERLSTNPPKRHNLPFELYEKVMREMHRANLAAVSVSLVGFGEPLFNSRSHDMARLARELFPSARIFMDTNGNFGDRRAAEIADCGLSDIRLGIDGCDQVSYATYREKGNFAKAYAFAGKLAEAIRQTGSETQAVWKYILFRHNDRDEQIALAVKLAADIGMPIAFDRTVGHLASKRPTAEIQELIGQIKIGCNVDVAAFE